VLKLNPLLSSFLLTSLPTDPVYTVSGARDHYREQSRAGGFLLERVPEFNNFFSEIPTHPSQTFRCGSFASAAGTLKSIPPCQSSAARAGCQPDLAFFCVERKWGRGRVSSVRGE
jgi:hypothetical protein